MLEGVYDDFKDTVYRAAAAAAHRVDQRADVRTDDCGGEEAREEERASLLVGEPMLCIQGVEVGSLQPVSKCDDCVH